MYHAASQRQYYQRNKEKIIARVKAWKKLHPDKIKRKRPSVSKSFSPHRDFFKPLLSIPLEDIEPLLQQFNTVSLTSTQFIILSLLNKHTLTQKTMATMLKISQSYVNKVINKQLFTKLKPIISKHKTKNQELLNLIMKVIINVK